MIDCDRVRQRREELLLTLDDIAIFVGVRVETVDNWEHGISNPKKGNLQALAKVLQTTTDYLEGNTDLPDDYSRSENVCITCGKTIPFGSSKCPDCRWGRWSSDFLNSPMFEKRRKRSHSVDLLSLDRDKGIATFVSTTSYGQNFYTTSLDMCTCPDFENRQLPCKHIFRLAEELGLIHCEHFAPGEDDYTMHFDSLPAIITPEIVEDTLIPAQNEPVASELPAHSALPAVAIQPGKPNRIARIFAKLLKFACCCVFGLIAVVCIFGAITHGKELWCFPAGLVIGGLLTAGAAKRHALGSAFKWGVYGALVPVASWIDVVMARSKSKPKGFLKGIAYSLCGLVVFLAIFSTFLPPATPKEPVVEKLPTIASVSADSSASPSLPQSLAVVPTKTEANIVAVAPAVSKSKPATSSKATKPQPEKVSVYLGENRVLIDPHDNDDEEVSQPVRKSQNNAVNVVITPKGKKYHYSSCRTVRGKYTVLTVAQARKRGYKPCKVCNPPSR